MDGSVSTRLSVLAVEQRAYKELRGAGGGIGQRGPLSVRVRREEFDTDLLGFHFGSIY